ncbi:OmpA family protein [Dysgonomonas alginatilytica]|uniref:OmpA family protein n=1 Tax=Dysgonomonas alginatilytica TaxID=1605892 RepID=A0A2V3PM02_9BACT|nr:OmpA family protein [Dysgonomonas alginatilytica]PXV60929.1 OmpA family protein [Dysgonomonas alginatilytica]
MKKIILVVATALLSMTGFAQEKAIKQYGFWDNWFLQGQVGVSHTFSENFKRTDLTNLLSPHVAVSAGKYFSPEMGARLQVGGWDAKSFNPAINGTYKINYIQASVDGLLNLTNLFTTYTEDRFFNLTGIVGVGVLHGFKNEDHDVRVTNSVVPRVGLQADFRLNQDISLNIEGIGNLMNDDFNGVVGGTKYDATLNVLAGITYRFNKQGFERVDIIDPAQIQSLNDQINAQRSQLRDKDRDIQKYQSEISRLAAQPVVVEEVRGETEVLMNAVVVFRLGSAKLEQNQDINIYNAAKYLRENPKVNITVTGYADKATGTPAINQRLSEQRAQAVADILINKYGIASGRINVQASGDREQPFEINEWNRVVVFTANN